MNLVKHWLYRYYSVRTNKGIKTMTRIENDAFFTPDNVALACVEDFYKETPEYRNNEIVEPSAGGGAFLRAFEKLGLSYEAYDLNPQAENITQADYLSTDIDLTGKVVLGNPPYGRLNKLSKAFIKRSFEQGAEAVGFLLFGGILSHSVLKSIGYKVEYFKRLEPVNFIDKDDNIVLKSKGLFEVVFIVWSKEELQTITKTFVEHGELSSFDFFVNYGGIFEKDDSIVKSHKRPNEKKHRLNEWVVSSHQKRISYIFKVYDGFEKETYKKLQWISINGRISPDTINFYASYPELNRGWISVDD